MKHINYYMKSPLITPEDLYDDNFDYIEEEYSIEETPIPEYESDYELLPDSDLTKYYEFYKNSIDVLEDVLKSHKREITRIKRAIEIKNMDIPDNDKSEKIKDIWEPEADDLLPETLPECHKIIIALRKVVRSK